MFSRKRLAYIIIITIVFSGLFFLFNLNHEFLRSQSVNIADDIILPKKYSAENLSETDIGFLVIGDPQSESERLIKANVIKALDQIKAKTKQVNTLNDTDLINDVILVFVISDIKQSGDLEKIAQYIKDHSPFRRAVWMDHLSDELLLESYNTANELQLSPDFISLIEDELHRRYLSDKIKCTQSS